MPNRQRFTCSLKKLVIFTCMCWTLSLLLYHHSVYRNSTTEDAVSGVYDAMTEMRQRQLSIASLCQTDKFTREFGAGEAHSSIVSTDLVTLTYCPIPRAGWTTWKRLFYRDYGLEYLMNDTKHSGFDSEWDKVDLGVKRNKLKLKTKHRMVFVRHPYDRLVSAYKDRVLRNGGKVEQRFCDNFNPPPNPALTFSQFVQCIIDQAHDGKRRTPRLGYGGTLDAFYKPQTLLCDFCSTNYNIIGHVEHMDEDIIAALNILNMADKTPVRENQSDNNQIPLSYWYSQLSLELIAELQRLYAYDFELLGYSSDVSLNPEL